MPINKAALLSVIDTTLDEHAKAQREYDAKVVEWQHQRRLNWDAETAPLFRSLRDMLTAKLKAGQVITSEDVTKALGKDRYGYARDTSNFTWNPDREPGRSEVKTVPQVDVPMLNQVKAALSVIDGETVSISALSQWGFRNLGPLFKAAAQLSK